MMRYWNGHCWVDRCNACGTFIERKRVHVCGPYLAPITIACEQLEDATANPLNLVDRMMKIERDDDADDRYAGAVLGFDLGAKPSISAKRVGPWSARSGLDACDDEHPLPVCISDRCHLRPSTAFEVKLYSNIPKEE